MPICTLPILKSIATKGTTLKSPDLIDANTLVGGRFCSGAPKNKQLRFSLSITKSLSLGGDSSLVSSDSLCCVSFFLDGSVNYFDILLGLPILSISSPVRTQLPKSWKVKLNLRLANCAGS